MQPLKSPREYFELAMFEDKVRIAKEAGARFTPPQIAFLKDALYEGYRLAMGRSPKAMSPRERNLKKTFVDGLRSSMADLDSCLFLMNTIYQVPTRLTPKDLRRALPKEKVASFVSALCGVFGKEYADSLLVVVTAAYAKVGERIQIVRDPS